MREQEFRTRDKVVHKMAREGLQEKNLTRGTEQGISQRDGDFSFQTHGEREGKGDMAGRTEAGGRESHRQVRNISSRQTERDGEQSGAFSVSQESDSRDWNREAPGSGDIFSGKRQETADARKHSTCEKQGRQPLYAFRETVPETAPVQRDYSMEQTDDSRESGLIPSEIQRNGEESTGGQAEAMQSRYGRPQISAAVEQQRKRKLQRTHAKAWRDSGSVSGSLSRNPDVAEGRAEAGFRGQASDSDTAGKGTEAGFRGQDSDSDTAGKRTEAKFQGQDSHTTGEGADAGSQGQERQEAESRRLKSRKPEPFVRKGETASRNLPKPERHTADAKARIRTEADSSEPSGEKRKNRREDGGNREGSRSAGRKGRLRFEPDSGSGKPEESLLKRTGGGLVHTAQTAAVGKLHQKIREVEQDNTGVESAHKAEAAVERVAGRAYHVRRERLRSRPYRAMKRAEKRAVEAERDAALKKLQTEYPQLQRKALAKWVQKQKIKRKYAAAAREASKGAGHSARFLSATGRVFRQVAEHVKKKAGGTAIGIIFVGVLLFSMCGSLFTSCSSLFTGAGSSLMSACYLAEDGEISSAELRYTELETDLQMDIAGTEWHHSGYDEYRYNIGEIGHNPYELMGYLSAVFNDFTYAQVEPELDRLFGLQYRLTREEVTETRTYLDEEGEEQEYEWRILKTVLSVRPLSEILSGSLAVGDQTERYGIYMQTYGGRQYFGNPFDFSWLGSVTSSYGYRVHPIHGGKDLHRGVDVGAAWGTPIRAIQDGRVASAGEAGSYGLCLVIAGEDGYQSRYAHCSSLAVSVGQEVRKGDIVAYVGNTGDSTGSHLHLEVVCDGEYLDPVYFVENGGGGYTAGGNAAGRPQFPADPGTPMGDGTFEAVREEAERHMGRPYVWGGSSPETSFDCSGYVSWVINHSGAGNVGRQTAQGLCNLCTPVAWEDLRPGDLVFFTGTYSSLTPVSHVGIYMGGGKMAHAGDPIGYADIGSSRYWKEHFYCGGRLP